MRKSCMRCGPATHSARKKRCARICRTDCATGWKLCKRDADRHRSRVGERACMTRVVTKKGKSVNDVEVGNKAWDSIPLGDDLGSLDYVLTAQMIADYKRVVDNPHAAYPTVAGRHPANL